MDENITTKRKSKKNISIRLREVTINDLKKIADKKDYNYTELARIIIENYVNNYNI